MKENSESKSVPAREKKNLFFRRAHRVRSRADFAHIYGQGVRARGRHILLVATLSNHPAGARLGLSVGRKYSPSAVLRNQAKRVLREVFRHIRAELPAWDFIVIPLRAGKKLPPAELEEEWTSLIPKLAQKMNP
ncbi:MAG: ribonuclease P protein component [Planctomycetota bacterium]|jgi:ribonuclease P protein component|nr:ribonuclease P protein component [Planctomycetota bacterium]MDP6942229.1 ribonuclease P protein component [Planctomycetota bacterium]